MGHNIELTIYEEKCHSINGNEFADKISKESTNLCVESIKPNAEGDNWIKTKLDIRVNHRLKYDSLTATKILCILLMKYNITNFKIINFD